MPYHQPREVIIFFPSFLSLWEGHFTERSEFICLELLNLWSACEPPGCSNAILSLWVWGGPESLHFKQAPRYSFSASHTLLSKVLSICLYLHHPLLPRKPFLLTHPLGFSSNVTSNPLESSSFFQWEEISCHVSFSVSLRTLMPSLLWHSYSCSRLWFHF